MGISEGFVGFGNWIKLQHFVAFVAVVKVVVVVAVVVGKEEGEVETKFARFAVGAVVADAVGGGGVGVGLIFVVADDDGGVAVDDDGSIIMGFGEADEDA
ncbi:hypothetical protein QQP08_020322, partial [Theobroma cacao]